MSFLHYLIIIYLFILLRFYFESLKEKFPYYSKLDSCRRGHLVICGQASRWSASIIVLLGHFFLIAHFPLKKQNKKRFHGFELLLPQLPGKKIAATVQDELFLIPVNIFASLIGESRACGTTLFHF